MNTSSKLILLGLVLLLGFSYCSVNQEAEADTKSDIITTTPTYGEFSSEVEWGEHLVTVSGCHDCHTPKIMTDHGPVLDSSRMLSGHPAKMPKIELDNASMEKMGLVVTRDLTEWIGPWGTSYTANLTPHETGLGNWTEEQFFKVLREGKYKGMDNSRMLLPPMPWEMFRNFTDNEIKAVFAYLKTVPAVDNLVPQPKPPAGGAPPHG